MDSEIYIHSQVKLRIYIAPRLNTFANTVYDIIINNNNNTSNRKSHNFENGGKKRGLECP